MPSLEHLEILKQGVEAWNEWRKLNPYIRPYLTDADLSGADLGGAYLRHAELGRMNLNGVNLSRADLIGAILNGSNLSGADLSHAMLQGATLTSVNLSHANLSHADLSYAKIQSPYLRGADFTNSYWQGTSLAAADVSEAIGLENVTHQTPSTVGVDTLYMSAGKIPEAFLRGCGIPEPFIVQLPALVASLEPIQFYSCFISYSSKDQQFAERLHADLQARGVRVWFAPHDLPIGARIRPAIDESIRVHDKLLLVLSEYSVTSQWVEQEVETALAKEREQEGRAVLFPIRIDDTVMESKAGWPALLKNTRNVGDFTRWKDHDSYQKAFERLLRDLKARGIAKARERPNATEAAVPVENAVSQLTAEFEEIKANIIFSTLAHVIAAELKRLKALIHRHSFLLNRSDVFNFYEAWLAPHEIHFEYGAQLNLKQAQYEQIKEQLANIDLRSSSP
jgi:uncharacterized protein YjbI with pentapeptide repeats